MDGCSCSMSRLPDHWHALQHPLPLLQLPSCLAMLLQDGKNCLPPNLPLVPLYLSVALHPQLQALPLDPAQSASRLGMTSCQIGCFCSGLPPALAVAHVAAPREQQELHYLLKSQPRLPCCLQRLRQIHVGSWRGACIADCTGAGCRRCQAWQAARWPRRHAARWQASPQYLGWQSGKTDLRPCWR